MNRGSDIEKRRPLVSQSPSEYFTFFRSHSPYHFISRQADLSLNAPTKRCAHLSRREKGVERAGRGIHLETTVLPQSFLVPESSRPLCCPFLSCFHPRARGRNGALTAKAGIAADSTRLHLVRQHLSSREVNALPHIGRSCATKSPYHTWVSHFCRVVFR